MLVWLAMGHAGTAEANPTDHAVLLDTGVVVTGVVERRGGSIVIRRGSHSTLRLPQHRALLTAVNEDELWRRFEAMHPGHRWLTRRATRKRSPSSNDSGSPVHGVDLAMETTVGESDPENQSSTSEPRFPGDANLSDTEVEDDRHVTTFVTQIQPLLVAHCGRCHDATANAGIASEAFALRFNQWRRVEGADGRWNLRVVQRSIRSVGPMEWMNYFFRPHGGMNRPILNPQHRLASERIWRFVESVGQDSDFRNSEAAAPTVETGQSNKQPAFATASPTDLGKGSERSVIKQVGYAEAIPEPFMGEPSEGGTEPSEGRRTSVKRLPSVPRPTDPSIFNRMPH